MLLRRLTIVLAAVGLLGSPVASLYCPSGDAAAMACCQRDANDCNRPGKSDDCCRTVPTDGQTVALAAKAGDVAKLQWIAAPAAVLPTFALPPAALTVTLGVRASRITPAFSPPPLSVLRI